MAERMARFERTGGPEVIEWVDIDLPPPVDNEVRVRHVAVGLNYIDTYYRSGIYPATLPSGLGSEAAGIVEAVGPGVSTLSPGDRVATFGPGLGAYATARNIRADALFRLPDDVDERTAAAILLKGCTAEFLVERCARIAPGDAVLVWAAAGGVGLLLLRWLRHLGAQVIAVVGDDAKAERVAGLGAALVLNHRRDDVAAQVRAFTGGRGVPVVLDGVGQGSWKPSLAAVGRRGLIVSYGNAGGAVTGVALGSLAQAGSVFVTRPTLFDYYREPAERSAGVERLWTLLRDGVLAAEIGQTFPLEQAAAAHRSLEASETTGSTLLLP